MGDKTHNEPFSMLEVLDMEFYPIQQDFEPLVIVLDDLSFFLLDFLYFCSALGL